MKNKAGINYCPKCGRQRVGNQEYDEEIRTMVFACDVDEIFTPYRILGQDPAEAPQIRITPTERRKCADAQTS